MALQLQTRRSTLEEYLAGEQSATSKHEYHNGEIIAMPGASRKHNLLVSNILASLHQQLRKSSCEVYPSDMRVKVSPSGLYTYPDVMVVCATPQFDDAQADTLLNPAMIVEVLSPSTAAYDRGAKFARYRQLASLTDYLLVDQEAIYIEHFTRQPDGSWRFVAVSNRQAFLRIQSIGCKLEVEDIYEKVDLPA
jgi:Uma2 family endonuclease